MSYERDDELEALFHAALELPREERRSFAARSCVHDAELEQELVELLEAHEGDPQFLANSPELANAAAPETIGPYRVLKPLGAGGMGVVVLAERIDGAFRRLVALKIVQPALAWEHEQRRELERRFLEERQLLARLDHPGIARLYDGGATEDGRPYLVMEYVDGAPLDRFVRERGLDLAARLKLFGEVCAAVQYAHQHLIAHRDIKPANILVDERDGVPHAKLLDFGIAKLLDAGAGDAQRTTLGSARLTPAYASPEQARGEPASASSDVYSLGVVLYELLTERLPFDAPLSSPSAVLRAVCDEPPVPPSRRNPRLRGDLETIVLKALEKSPDRRYASVAALGDDLQRFSDGRPILARPATLGYRLGKVLSRHRRAVAALALVSLAALASGVWSLRLRGATIEAGERATRERANALRATELFRELFAAPDPFARRGKDVTVLEVLDDAAPRVLGGLGADDEVRFELVSILADTYVALGEPIKGRTYSEDAVATGERLLPADSARLLTAQSRLARALVSTGDFPRAEELARAALASFERSTSAPAELRAELEQTWLLALREVGQDARACELARDLVERSRREHGEHDPRTLIVVNHLSSILIDLRQHAEAETLLRDTLAALPDDGSASRAADLALRHNLAFLLLRNEKTDEASELAHAVFEERRELLGESHVDTLLSLELVSELELVAGRAPRSEELARQALAARALRQGPDHPESIGVRMTLSYALAQQGRLEDALREMLHAWETARAAHGPEHYVALGAQGHLAQLLLALELPHEAEQLQREAVEIAERSLPPDDAIRGQALNNLAMTLSRLGRRDEAAQLQRDVVEFNRRVLGEGHGNTVISMANLGAILRDGGELRAAGEAYDQAAQCALAHLGESSTLTGGVFEGMARWAVLGGDLEFAECARLRAHEIYVRVLGAEHSASRAPLENAAQMWERAGEDERAAELRRKLDSLARE